MPKIERYLPYTVISAFDRAGKPIADASGDVGNINDSSVLTRIIQETGRFCESYASDMVITWDSVRKLYAKDRIPDITGPERYIETFAIRRSGVDGNAFLISRLKDTEDPVYGYVYAERTYRRILGLEIKITPRKSLPPKAELSLKDLTDSFRRLDKRDKN